MADSNQDPTRRFSARVENYVRFRPDYPPAVLEILKREIGLNPDWKIADLGSGTGISAELFLRNGNAVYGVEPNAPMREAAERPLAPHHLCTYNPFGCRRMTSRTKSVRAPPYC